MSIFSENLATILAEREISVRSLHEVSDVSRSVIGEYLKGTADPSAKNLEKISESLGLTMDELYSIPIK